MFSHGLRTIKNLLFQPDTFFSEITKEKENLTWPAVIVLLGGITTIVGAVIYAGNSHPFSVNSAVVGFETSFSYSFVFNFVFPLVFWAVASVSMYAVARKYSGSGSLKATFQNTGYGTFPVSALSALIQVQTILGISAIAQTPNFTFTDHPLFILSIFLGSIFPLFILWSCYLWVCSVRQTHRIPTGKAIIAVVCAFVILVIVNLIGLAL